MLVPTGSDVAACVDAPRHTRKAAQFVAGQVDRPPLDEPGRVESFALTANNITYAALGDMLNYWQFFPTGEAG